MSERNRIMADYQLGLISINALEQQMAGQAGYNAEQFSRMRENMEQLNDIRLDNLAQQFPDLAMTINQTAFQAFQGLSGSISALIKGTGTLEDVFDSFASTIIDRLVDIAVQWAASEIFSLFMNPASGTPSQPTGGGVDLIGAGMSMIPTVLGAFNDGGIIPGRYAGQSDRHIAMVNPGEFIMSRSAVARHGVGKLNAINTGNYDAGGYVGNIDPSPNQYKDYSTTPNQSSSPIQVEYSVTEINSVRYVSEEQFQRGLQATSQETEKRINRSMRNSPSYRSGIGI
jgi:lambda family phage tail tape measure protein